ncbi:prephenate dehydratase PheA [Methanobrevibacter ruminantium M1]|uniref:prephenate dehydratase n=1 Tax=Methanobrevibacter ruminantium (strain ATCC 35063 / DSM 1093 / JCM 13430 / OCM 146 / M1) TaxID=634498 RepID=D3E0B8_METRM|nr:prephenate dehydratase [Methanobrevibacter ruminantium]ADC47842.1 prephenate dehydratase PheA [Methanobrevibacter ruminantium M1]
MINDKVAFLGPQGTFSHEAASLLSDNLISYCSIQSVMDAVERGECRYGLVPIENSIEGPVSLTLDSLIHNFDLKIRNEIIIPINHNLLAASDISVDEVENVYSHAQALGQCQPYLERHNMVAHYTLSTAAAAKHVAETGEDAAIGTLKAAELYDLKVIDTNIQENYNNETRFVVLDTEDSPITGNDKTSISFSLFEDKPGGLYELLGYFASENINLTKIESRPSKEGLGHYIFFVDLEGHRLDENIAKILNNLEDNTSFFKILGSYPVYSRELFD